MPDPAPGFSIDAQQRDGHVHVVPRGELDIATAPKLEERLLGLLDEGTPVRLDLRELAFMDSTGVRVLVTAHRRGETGPTPLTIVAPPPGSPVERVLAISGIADQLGMLTE